MKLWKVALIVGVIAVLTVGAGVAFAQSDDTPPGEGEFPCNCLDADDRSGGGRPRAPFKALHGDLRDDGPPLDGDPLGLRDLMLTALADELGLTLEELEAQIEVEGGLMAVLLAQDLSLDDARALLLEVRTETIQEALEQGLIDEAQAERMLERMQPIGDRERGSGPRGHRPPGSSGDGSDCQVDS